MSLRLAFMGSPDFAVPALDALVGAGHEVVCVYSQPPRRAGRGKALRRTAVHDYADAKGIEVRTPVNFKSEEDRTEFAALDLDVAVVAAYGLLLPTAILAAPRLGCINLHGSLLPRWRGAAPIHRAVMAGDEITGVQVMQMEAGLDTGPVMMSAETEISATDTMLDVHDRLAALGADLIVRALAELEAGTAVFVPQSDDGVIYAHKISSEEAGIVWERDARDVSAHIRGLSPFPGAWFEYGEGPEKVRIKVLQAVVEDGAGAPGEVLDDTLLVACRRGAVRLLRLQRAGKGAMDATTFLRGTPILKGARLR